MHILVLTPLFPPDTAPSANYTKELAQRLATQHDVTVLLYGHLPENAGTAELVTIDKKNSTLSRIWHLTRQLFKQARKHDVVLVQNGPSVELPMLIAQLFSNTPTVLMYSDKPAFERTQKRYLTNLIHQLVVGNVTNIFSSSEAWPIAKPVIHPLKEYPTAQLSTWEDSWQTHLDSLSNKYLLP